MTHNTVDTESRDFQDESRIVIVTWLSFIVAPHFILLDRIEWYNTVEIQPRDCQVLWESTVLLKILWWKVAM